MISALIALISLGWIIRDLVTAEEPGHVWWSWAGLPRLFENQDIWVTGLADPVIALVCGAVAVTAMRSPSAASSLVAAGAVTVVLRGINLWILTEGWLGHYDDLDVHFQALLSAGVTVGLGGALLLTAAAGRRPVGHSGYGYPPTAADEEPPRLTTGAAATAFVLLGAVAAIWVAWEVDFFQEYGWKAYRTYLTGGEQAVGSMLGTPVRWAAVAFAVLALVAAVAALNRAVFSRPLGLAAGSAALFWGALSISLAIKYDTFDKVMDAPLRTQLSLLSSGFFVLAGAIVLAVLARPGRRPYQYQDSPQGWGPAGGYGPPPPSHPPPGW
ncbi:hypothetical protein [Streptomyces sp. NBC_01304]|uniref:hypothetical protein n=1 Tax=Streptomyces sp. NBC_01304 TaxID=2903818 RepID=UPI002E104FB0|nr:hypothetical protein OG430_18560 [Streptomyces sp. NBC_01304]